MHFQTTPGKIFPWCNFCWDKELVVIFLLAQLTPHLGCSPRAFFPGRDSCDVSVVLQLPQHLHHPELIVLVPSHSPILVPFLPQDVVGLVNTVLDLKKN